MKKNRVGTDVKNVCGTRKTETTTLEHPARESTIAQKWFHWPACHWGLHCRRVRGGKRRLVPHCWVSTSAVSTASQHRIVIVWRVNTQTDTNHTDTFILTHRAVPKFLIFPPKGSKILSRTTRGKCLFCKCKLYSLSLPELAELSTSTRLILAFFLRPAGP